MAELDWREVMPLELWEDQEAWEKRHHALFLRNLGQTLSDCARQVGWSLSWTSEQVQRAKVERDSREFSPLELWLAGQPEPLMVEDREAPGDYYGPARKEASEAWQEFHALTRKKVSLRRGEDAIARLQKEASELVRETSEVQARLARVRDEQALIRDNAALPIAYELLGGERGHLERLNAGKLVELAGLRQAIEDQRRALEALRMELAITTH